MALRAYFVREVRQQAIELGNKLNAAKKRVFKLINLMQVK